MWHHLSAKGSFKKSRYRFQLNTLARQFVEVVVIPDNALKMPG